MTITIKLPNSKKEANFIIELLNKLDVPMVYSEDDEVSEEHKQILDERIEKIRSNPDMKYYSWDEVKKLTTQRKVSV
jgi:D-ribose pyranose/furanose isomerase RbsD